MTGDKVVVIGAGRVGAACAKAMMLQVVCRQIVLLDEVSARASAVAEDLSHGSVLLPAVDVSSGSYGALRDASLVVITAGINERAGGADDRDDPRGRLGLLSDNAVIYGEIVPRVAAVAPDAPILVVTDPPDALADVARHYTGTNPIISSGTFLDSLRFRYQLAKKLECRATAVDAHVLGEHGTSAVYAFESARVGLCPVLDMVDGDQQRFRAEVEEAVKYANIEIIEGNEASQHAIGIVVSRIASAILSDEGLVAPVGTWQPQYGVTLSLPSLIGQGGVKRVFHPKLDEDEARGLKASAEVLASALQEVGFDANPQADQLPHRHVANSEILGEESELS